MLPFCQFISNKAWVIVRSQILKDPGHGLTLLPLATKMLTMGRVWIGTSKVKSSVQSRMKIKTKYQKVIQRRWMLLVLKILSQIQADEFFTGQDIMFVLIGCNWCTFPLDIEMFVNNIKTINSGGSRISHKGGGIDLIGGRGLPRQLHFENFVCQNERIWPLGGRAPGTPSLDPPMINL